MESYDVIVLGLGAMGSHTAFHLAKKNLKVLGLEQYDRCHALGSSHGKTRLIRKAYFEHPDYVPLLERSYTLWNELERESGQKLFTQAGLIIFGGPESQVLEGVRKSGRLYQIPIEEYGHDDCRARYPQFEIPPNFGGIYEATGGFLEVEKSIDAALACAEKRGASFRFRVAVQKIEQHATGVRVETALGSYVAKHLVVTAGAWSSSWLQDLKLSLKVYRVPQFWFEAPGLLSLESGLPCFAFDRPDGFYYGFPDLGGYGLKVALHKPGAEVIDPSKVERQIVSADLNEVQNFLSQTLPAVAKLPTHASVCMYTMTPDGNFIIDRHPGFSALCFAAGFSGHGFKFAPVVGERLAEIVLQTKATQPFDFLKLRPQVYS